MIRGVQLAILVTVALAVDVTERSSAGSPPPPFESATAGYRYEFPRDHGSHPSYRTEWWYYTGHLHTTSGRSFGFELTFFRRGVSPEDIKTLPSKWSLHHIYLAHFAVTDITGKRFHFSEKLSREGLGKAGADESRLHVWIDKWSAEADPDPAGVHTLVAHDETHSLTLTLQPTKPPVINGREGISRKGKGVGHASHYYSFTRLSTTGSLTIDGEQFDVIGTSWMDHEFLSTELGADQVGWDWFSLQLEDNTELMLYRMRLKDGSTDLASSGTAVSVDGRTQHLEVTDFQIESTATWTSPESKATYPAKWRLKFPSLDLVLEVTPLLGDQELRPSRSTQVNYWEGAVVMNGTKRGKPIKGHGYVELTGYTERLKL
ncbi:MAG: carotenoid 1,2-hydratase [Nitrospira sp.]|nr:carotenoid 1,2-hydratase [Nitrospira sp.]MDH4245960.1 carotenoid 1,2-hydratase [Nitrospira sp.]MDH4358181.1 carotenoid 1,2-hydratase [Nitrospira sp.]MDH5320622.1 carotenoid 1,2-hydratase [Nitrospira sp.]